MAYPEPDEALYQEWQSITDTLRENLPVDVALLRVAGGGSLRIAAVAGDDSVFSIGDEAPQDGGSFCDHLLEGEDLLVVTDASNDPRWSAIAEFQSGFRAYLGAPLRWPDGEAYGSVSILCRQPLPAETTSRVERLLRRLGRGASAQLGMLMLREQNNYDATHDELTGLPNHGLFNELAKVQTRMAERSSEGVWLAMWSVDGYSEVALEMGPDKADTMLHVASERARACTRGSDVLARLGDNRFAFLLSGANEFVANSVSDRLRRSLNSMKSESGNGRPITVSCGMTPYHRDEAMDHWMSRAKTAMEDARSAGGGITIIKDVKH